MSRTEERGARAALPARRGMQCLAHFVGVLSTRIVTEKGRGSGEREVMWATGRLPLTWTVAWWAVEECDRAWIACVAESANSAEESSSRGRETTELRASYCVIYSVLCAVQCCCSRYAGEKAVGGGERRARRLVAHISAVWGDVRGRGCPPCASAPRRCVGRTLKG